MEDHVLVFVDFLPPDQVQSRSNQSLNQSLNQQHLFIKRTLQFESEMLLAEPFGEQLDGDNTRAYFAQQ